MTDKFDYKQKCEEIGRRHRENRLKTEVESGQPPEGQAEEEKPDNPPKENPAEKEKKFCPLLSTHEVLTSCKPACKIYRNKPKGYECMIQELPAIAWFLKKILQSKKTYQ